MCLEWKKKCISGSWWAGGKVKLEPKIQKCYDKMHWKYGCARSATPYQTKI